MSGYCECDQCLAERKAAESHTLSERLQVAFDVAEMETAHEYHGQTCSMTDRFGISTCPICFFRRRVKAHLGLK